MVLIGIILILVLVGLGLLILLNTEHAAIGGWLFGIGLLLFVVLVGIWPISYADSVKENGWLRATQKNIVIAQQVASQINEVASVKDVRPGTMVGGVENMQQSSNASEAVRDYGSLVQRYNTVIGRRQTQLDNWFMRSFVVPLPAGIQMVEGISFH